MQFEFTNGHVEHKQMADKLKQTMKANGINSNKFCHRNVTSCTLVDNIACVHAYRIAAANQSACSAMTYQVLAMIYMCNS